MNTTSHTEGTLMAFIVALLAPIFLGVSGGNIALARSAAVETINDYRARNNAGLIAVAQIIAFGLAALGSLSLSMDDGVSVTMALRLRGNANACNRSAEQNRKALQASHDLQRDKHDAENAAFQNAIFASPPPPGPQPLLSAEAERVLAAEAEARLQPSRGTIGQAAAPQTSAAQPAAAPAEAPAARAAGPTRSSQAWAAVMTAEAAKITANLPNLPPDQREAASMRANALASTANSILCAATVSGLSRADAKPA